MNVNKSTNEKCTKFCTEYTGNTKEIRRTYERNTNEIRTKCECIQIKVRTKNVRNFARNTNEIRKKYEGHTNEIQLKYERNANVYQQNNYFFRAGLRATGKF